MSSVTDSVDPVRGWLAGLLAALAALVVGATVFPKLVYERFIWQYFWGPVHADAVGARCAVRVESGIELLGSTSACRSAIEGGAVVAEPGYTLISEAGYIIVLLFMLSGVLLLLRRLDVGRTRGFLYALVPFVLLGGVLRVVEDANDAARAAGAEQFVNYPANALIISPVIYFVMFVLTLVALLASVWLARQQIVERYQSALAAIGVFVLAATLGFLGYLSISTEYVGFYPQMLVLTLGSATVIALAIYGVIERRAPALHAGTGLAGLVVLWRQAVDGVANVLAADWANAIGLPEAYSAKHPLNQIIIDVTDAVVPGSITDTIGTSWPFPLVKLLLAVGVIWLFDARMFEESRRYTLLLLLAIVAVGLGPGTRDMLRATFGI